MREEEAYPELSFGFFSGEAALHALEELFECKYTITVAIKSFEHLLGFRDTVLLTSTF